MTAAPEVSRGFWPGVCLVGIGLVAACLAIASGEWFSRDDFAFLAYVQSPDFGWREAFLPLESRFWPFYRPLGMETYFRTCFALFGVEAFGYFAVSLAFHFGSGGLVYGVARRLGFDSRAAVVAALLAVSRPAALDEIFYGSVFHLVASGFFTAVVVLCFLTGLEREGRDRGWAAGSVAALILALLCNEVNAVVPALVVCAGLAAQGPSRRHAARVLRGVVPHGVLVGLYLGFRFFVLPPRAASPVYTPALGPHVVEHLTALLTRGFGGAWVLAVLAVLGATFAGFQGRIRAERAVLERLAWRAALLLGWALLALAPFALLPFEQQRYAMLAATPVALVCGALADAAWACLGARRPRQLEAALLASILLLLPYGVLLERFRTPRGAEPLRLLRALESRRSALPERARIVLLYGSAGLASSDRAIPFRYLAYNGTVLQAVYPESELSLRFHDLSQRAPRSVIRPGTVYLQLGPDLEIEGVRPALLQRELLRGFEPAPPG